MCSLIVGRRYNRKQISQIIGGNEQLYLPHKDGRILAACLKPSENPEAPEVILAGDTDGQKMYADMLCKQTSPVPVFVEKASKEWEYVGQYRVADYSDDPEVIRERSSKLASPRDNVYKVIFLEATESPIS